MKIKRKKIKKIDKKNTTFQTFDIIKNLTINCDKETDIILKSMKKEINLSNNKPILRINGRPLENHRYNIIFFE